MITITLVLLYTNGQASERVTVSLFTVPRVDELVSLSGRLYRVSDITHSIEDQGIEVRAIA